VRAADLGFCAVLCAIRDSNPEPAEIGRASARCFGDRADMPPDLGIHRPDDSGAPSAFRAVSR
jgi:hypothetical protein